MIGIQKQLTSVKNFSVLIIVTTSSLFALSACKQTPPDSRAVVSLPIYESGDSVRGEQLYEDNCSQCHKLQLGQNKKGPQLLGVYGAPSAVLKDYKYSEAMQAANYTWDAKTLDAYIADPLAVMPDTRMLSDPMPNEADRQDIIAYLSTLGRETADVSNTFSEK